MLKNKTKRYRYIKEYYFFCKRIMIKFYDVYESMMSMKTTTKMMTMMNKEEFMLKGNWRLSTQDIDENYVLSNIEVEEKTQKRYTLNTAVNVCI